MTGDYLTTPIDETSRAALEGRALRMMLIGASDPALRADWFRAERRGFYETRPTQEILDSLVTNLSWRRATGVWDDSIAEPAVPVATTDSWPIPLSVPGDAAVDAWAISGVTVSPTHRRRGIARALVEAELRTAHRLGVPVAILTVSEATLYGRYGFSPAVLAADWSIDLRRVDWTGPEVPGRIHFVDPESLRAQAPEIHDRARLRSPGEIAIWDLQWDSVFGRGPEAEDSARRLRSVRYDDADGVAQGFALYRVKENDSDFTAHSAELVYLAAATDDAYSALWRFLLTLDLVSQLTAHVRSVEEPFVWQIADYRAAEKTAESDHLWLRILDPKAALEARRYSAPGRFAIDVEDPLGFVEGRLDLEIAADGRARVQAGRGDLPAGAAHVSLTVRELSSIYLGGVRAANLAAAGRIRELAPGSVSALDAAFRSSRAPWQSIWF